MGAVHADGAHPFEHADGRSLDSQRPRIEAHRNERSLPCVNEVTGGEVTRTVTSLHHRPPLATVEREHLGPRVVDVLAADDGEEQLPSIGEEIGPAMRDLPRCQRRQRADLAPGGREDSKTLGPSAAKIDAPIRSPDPRAERARQFRHLAAGEVQRDELAAIVEGDRAAVGREERIAPAGGARERSRGQGVEGAHVELLHASSVTGRIDDVLAIRRHRGNADVPDIGGG